MADSTGRTHNVIGTTPENESYSPLWSVNIYDNQAFASVKDFESAANASSLGYGVATVNCPVVEHAQK